LELSGKAKSNAGTGEKAGAGEGIPEKHHPRVEEKN